jgi:aromatic ring-opening dioxygenase LigB subunit
MLSSNHRLDEKYEKKLLKKFQTSNLRSHHFDLGMEIIYEKEGSYQSMLFNKNILNPWHNYKIHTYIIYYTNGGLDKTK